MHREVLCAKARRLRHPPGLKRVRMYRVALGHHQISTLAGLRREGGLDATSSSKRFRRVAPATTTCRWSAQRRDVGSHRAQRYGG
jgi:hypothetical protein